MRFFTIFTHFCRIFRSAYNERLTLTNHTNFVSAVCVLDGGKWICTGSNDTTICVYVAGNAEPFIILRGHSSTGNNSITFQFLEKLIVLTCYVVLT